MGPRVRIHPPGSFPVGMKRERPVSWASFAALLLATVPGPVVAQTPVESHSISGVVIDAETGEPLAGSAVLLAPLPEGIVPERGASALLPSSWSTTTSDDGSYLFRGLASGEYALLVSRLDYKPARVDVELVASRARVSVGLVVDPIIMEPREVLVRSTALLGREIGDTTLHGTDRTSLERDRQERYLASDARIVTPGDVRDAVTLAETDLFRALQRLPGVSTRDDYTAELWARGAPWSHTRITFDGVPLLNPLHGVGMFSGVNPDAVGAIFFHPGARPARFGEGAAAVVDVSTRPAPAEAELRGRAEISLLSARGVLERGFGEDRGGWVIAGRRSYLDLVSLVIEELGGGSEVHVPYDFHDLTGRLDLALGGRSSLEASAIWQQDAVRGEIPDEPDASRSRWGNAAGRVTFDTSRFGHRIRHTVGGSHFYARGLKDPEGEIAEVRQSFTFPWEDPTQSTLDIAIRQGEIGPLQGSPSQEWESGYALIAQRQRYRGPAPTPYPGRTTLRHVALDQELGILATWAERRWRLSEFLEIETGLRAETGSRIQDAGRVRLAPRVSARRRLVDSATFVSAGWSRSWQYAQTVSPVGLSVGPRLHPSDLWILAGDSPALRSDLVTLGGEGWLGAGWLITATGWLRTVQGFTVPPPTEGTVPDEPILSVGTNRAHGIELSLRRLAGTWTGSVSYTLSKSSVEADEWTFPAASDRHHVADASLIGQVSPSVRVGTALAWWSGAPYTRFFPATLDCDFALESCRITDSARVEEPNAERTDDYASVDGLVEWTMGRETWDLTVYGQVRNLLGRRNAITYLGSHLECRSAPVAGECPSSFRVVDEFDRGLPWLPTVGLRVSF